ncbi:ornithine carbamoyltransferase [Halovenus salina]|uniref:ornithine carbamoyltransferase n=1 Tax=Halovenus salina TaxID=1510225 RepID=UPI002260C995|nr:ornithine carbamoyltransferase [Halovenus salina]
MNNPQTDAHRNLVTIDDLTSEELETVLDDAAARKATAPAERAQPLAGQTMAMLFEKPSTRTRVSFETGMTQLGGHAIFLGPEDIHLGHGEPICDTARALSGYVDFIIARVFDHGDVVDLAKYAGVPVVNALTDDAHPCQTLADLLTIREQFGDLDVSVAWVGDGNNVCQSFALGAAMTELDLTVATPEGYEIDDSVRERATSVGTAPTETNDPEAAVADADLVYTDVWVSMGQGDERDQRLDDFAGFQVTPSLVGDRPVMHCLPAHRGEEITDETLESENALVWQQAENRLHAQNGLLTWLAE